MVKRLKNSFHRYAKFESFKKNLREDLPGLFNEAFILRRYPERLKHALNGDLVLPPYEVIIHPTSYCNLRCEWCIGGSVPTKEGKTKETLEKLPSRLADPAKMEKMIRNLLGYQKEIVTSKGEKEVFRIENFSFSGLVGEPFMAKEAFIRAVNLLTKKGVRVGVYSNAVLIDDRVVEALLGIAYINISIDAGSPVVYSKLKYGGDSQEGRDCFKKVIENIRALSRAREESKSSLDINASFVLYPWNYKDIYKAAKLLKSLGVNILRMKQNNSGANLLSKKQMKEANKLLSKVEALIDDNFNFLRIHTSNNPSEMERTVRECIITDLMGAIGSDGRVYPCNYHPRVGGYGYGDAINQDFQKIWEGEDRQRIKAELPSICPPNCDPFKNRANRLFVAIKKYRERYGEERVEALMDQIINYVPINKK